MLNAEVTPKLSTDTWTFPSRGSSSAPTTWTWDEIHALRAVDLRRRHPLRHDVVEVRHDVRRRLGRHAAGDRRPAARAPTHVIAFSHTGYTTNLPLADVTGGKAWVVWEVDGAPLPVDHGGPARLLVPHLYFWKSAKWVAGLRLLDHDEPGFWERNGYHDRGDPWLEQRYQGD